MASLAAPAAVAAPTPATAPDPQFVLPDDAPRGEIRKGMAMLGALALVLVAMGAFIPLDAAAIAGGRLVVVGQRQTVQHATGGSIHKVHVREGGVVAAGAPLIEFVGTEERQTERALASQRLSLEAQRARLLAELGGQSTISWPAVLTEASAEDAEAARTAMAIQLAEFNAARSALAAEIGALRQQEQRARESAVGFSKQIVASSEQARLIDEELKALAPVAEKGFVSRSRLRALERAKAELIGREGEYRANAAQAGTSAGESRIRQVEAEQSRRQALAATLREVETALAEMLPRYRIARERRDKLIVRAPQGGTIVGLTVFNSGSVASAGQRLLDIVPQQARLEIQAQVPLEDGDDLQVGQKVEVKFTGLHDRGLPVLEGKLLNFSADALTDEVTKAGYYLATIELPADQLDIIRSVRGPDFSLRAGAPVMVMLPTRSRTALQYLFEPLTDSIWRSFRQQ